MASLVPSLILDAVVKNVKRFPLDQQVPVDALNCASSMFWQFANWEWTVGSLAVVVTAAADKSYPITIPADYLHPIDATIAYDTGTSSTLVCEAFLHPDYTRVGSPSMFSIINNGDGTGQLILSPIPANNLTNARIYVRYKKVTPRITSANQHQPGTLVFPDEYESVFREALLHYAFRFSEDSRAGTVQIATNGTAQYSGQFAVARAAMADLAARIPVLSTDRNQQEKGR